MSTESSLAKALAHCEEAEAKRLVEEKIAAGVPADDILAECNQGMIELGQRFSREECFIPDLMFGGMIMKDITSRLAPLLQQHEQVQQGDRPKAVIGTVQYDIHDIGKDIVVMLLEGAGFQVVDLGVDVPPERFVEAIDQHQPPVVGMSLLLTTCYESVANTVEAIRDAGLRDGIRIMVGGAAASELLCEKAGCDFYGKTAVDGLQYARQVTGSNTGG